MLVALQTLHRELRSLRKELSSVKTDRINKKSIRNAAETIGAKWFSDFSESLVNKHGRSPDLIQEYSKHFGRLIKVSSPSNLKKSYTDALGSILKSFRDELIIPLQIEPRGIPQGSMLSEVLDGLPSTDESVYLNEAIDCAGHEFYRASVVLGWCAAIDRIQRAIQKTGFPKFNIASATMASQTTGRFKRFNAVQKVSSLSELREVFDTVILWIIEGMGIIDNNQHTRLRSCFDMRCQSAHPGDAPVTKYNLLSYFSDLNEIVFKNEKFKTD